MTTGAAAPSPPVPRSSWRTRDRVLSLDAPVVMGILNVTPDSFSDGGTLPDISAVVDRAASLVRDGAGILDVGGESTRPGARPVPWEEEVDRVVGALEALASRFEVPLSIDTRKARVARLGVEAGASIVNDVSGLAHDPDMAGTVGGTGAGLVLMHMRGDPGDMQERTGYADLLGEVTTELGRGLERARAAGIDEERIVIDPGFGFAKTPGQNLVLLRELGTLRRLGRPILVGPSRKRFLGEILGVPPEERAVGTAAACVLAYLEGATVFRVHDVGAVAQALAVARAVRGPVPASHS